MDVRNRKGREIRSPDTAKICKQSQARVKPMSRRVQVVYYLTRNGQLEHPHFMEVSHLANHPLRLRDVIERLAALRGKGMPSLYSWSCKRRYKNGFVWNDLAENDAIHPSDGAEYVLKGSELFQGGSEKFQEHQINSRPLHIQEPNGHHLSSSKPKRRNRVHQDSEKTTSSYGDEDLVEEDEEREEEYEIDEEKTSDTSSTTPHSRCSRGVSTDELELLDVQKPVNKNRSESNRPDSTELTTGDTEKPSSGNTSQRFEDGDPVVSGSCPSSRSVLLQLIACGNIAVAKAKNMPSSKQPANANAKMMSSDNIHRGVLCKNLNNKVAVREEEEDKEMIRFMSENPRFGNLQAEEKEYFSGSIVESASQERVMAERVLKKSNSYNEERSTKSSTVKAEDDNEEKREGKATVGKCIP